jgi:hypothetical protein
LPAQPSSASRFSILWIMKRRNNTFVLIAAVLLADTLFGPGYFIVGINALRISVMTVSNFIISRILTFNYERCGRMVNCLLRSFQLHNTSFLVNMFKVFVRPIVDYCYSIYCPHTLQNVQLIESIQRSFTRRIICNDGMSYPDRLNLLELETLERRGIKNDLIKAYKIIWLNFGNLNLLDLVDNKLGLRSNGDILSTVGPNGELNHVLLPTVKLNQSGHPDLGCRKFFYSNRIVNIWNALKRETVLAPNLHSFKTHLDLDLPPSASYLPPTVSHVLL